MNHLFQMTETDKELLTICKTQTDVLMKPKTIVKRPSMYKVILLNDDYTPMEFVVYILEQFFSKTAEEAVAIMLAVHNQGSAVCGVFTYEIAEAKMSSVLSCAAEHGHPLECTIEKE